MSIALNHFQCHLDYLTNLDEHAQIRECGIFEHVDHILISVQWYDESEESYKYFFSEEEMPKAVEIAQKSGWDFWTIDRVAMTLPWDK